MGAIRRKNLESNLLHVKYNISPFNITVTLGEHILLLYDKFPHLSPDRPKSGIVPESISFSNFDVIFLCNKS